MIFNNEYKKVINKGYYIQCDTCGDITLVRKSEYNWWKYMYDKRNGYYTDIENTSVYGNPGWHITKETVVCPKCHDVRKLAFTLRNLSDEEYAKLKEYVKESSGDL